MDNKIEIKEQVRSMQDEDGAVILDLRKGKYYSLNGVGATIWTRVERGSTLAEVLTHLTETYMAPKEQLEQDLQLFIHSLEKKGLIRASV